MYTYNYIYVLHVHEINMKSIINCLCSPSQFEGTLYTFGFGSDHDANLLEAISTQGGGVYYYIDTNEKVLYIMLVWGFILCSHWSDSRVVCGLSWWTAECGSSELVSVYRASGGQHCVPGPRQQSHQLEHSWQEVSLTCSLIES